MYIKKGLRFKQLELDFLYYTKGLKIEIPKISVQKKKQSIKKLLLEKVGLFVKVKKG